MNRLTKDIDITIRRPADIRPAAIRLRDWSQPVGPFIIGACDDIAKSAPMRDADGNVLAEAVFGWKDRSNWYTNKLLALVDPISHMCRFESEPFCFCDGKFISDQPLSFINDNRVPNMEKIGFIPTGGIVVPVHMPLGIIGLVAWYTFEKEFDVVSAYRAHADELLALASRFVNGYRKVMGRCSQLDAAGIRLVKREVQCLRWAAFGKTDEEIARIIERSASTVRFHLNNAAEKLNATNRLQTVLKAAQLGFIGQYQYGRS